MVRSHFEKTFKDSNEPRPLLEGIQFNSMSAADNDMLTRPFLVEEIKEAIWECDDNKSLGPDRFNFSFL